MRIERDTMGEVEVPDDAYYGAQTARAMINFPISGRRQDSLLIRAYGAVKKAAARANMQLGVLDEERGNAIVQAAGEVQEGRFADQFPVDAFQAGGGTSTNMNLNEVIANRALEILGRPRGNIDHIHPNDHVNRSQSSNDTYPSAAHIAAVWAISGLEREVAALSAAFYAKGREFADIPKAGRTHLMDALPVTLGSEFVAYGLALKRANGRLRYRKDELLELEVGGTGVGTGAEAPEGFKERTITLISEDLSLPFWPSLDGQEALQSRAPLGTAMSSLKGLSVELLRVCNDLRLLNSGPEAGIGEIALPPVQPGSSIMPGKVNPSVPECLTMVCFQVIGSELAVTMAWQAGQLELNVFVPSITYNVLESARVLTNAVHAMRARCVEGIQARPERCQELLRKDASLVTLLLPSLGYRKAAEVWNETVRSGEPLEDVVERMGIMGREDAMKLLGPWLRPVKGK